MSRYFIIFDVMVNGLVSLISLSDRLLVYMNTRDFCVLIFYSANFTKFIDEL